MATHRKSKKGVPEKTKQASKIAPAKPLREHAHKPTPESREVVRALAAAGEQPESICTYLTHMLRNPCKSTATLKRHYHVELATAKTHRKLMVGQSLYRQAVGAPAEYDDQRNKVRDEVKPNVTAGIFYAKTQMGWVEAQKHEHSGPDGKPIPVNISSLTDTQLEQLIARLEAKVAGG